MWENIYTGEQITNDIAMEMNDLFIEENWKWRD